MVVQQRPLQAVTPGRLSHHAHAAELVRSMARANRVDSTYIRTVVAHVEDQRGVLEALLDHHVLRELVRVDITREAWTVEAFACQLLGTSFHGLTFSLQPSPDRPFPSASMLTPVEPDMMSRRDRQRIPAVVRKATIAMYDTARRSVPIFDGTTIEEFLVQLPNTSPGDGAPGAGESFQGVAVRVAGLARSLGRPLPFMHAPVAVPRRHAPRGVTGPCLRFGVSFPHADDSQRLSFGTRLVGLCCEKGYGLWQRATPMSDHHHDYWEQVVRPSPVTGGDPAARPSTDAPHQGLAVTCVGPARPGTTEAILQVLADAGAPVTGLSETWLDDITIVHLLTRTPLEADALDGLAEDLRADAALSRALGLPAGERVRNDMLRDYRAVVSPCRDHRPAAGLTALWLAWRTPATPDALRLAVRTLRDALDDTWARHPAAVEDVPDGHLNIEYLICREEPSADRLRGRMRVAVDLDALGVTFPAEPLEDVIAGEDPNDALSAPGAGSQLGEFCSNLERHWRASLSFALGTPHVELDVVWRESWLGRWTSMEAG